MTTKQKEGDAFELIGIGPEGHANLAAAELRAVEERNKELEAVIFHYRERARCAEEWLQRIEREVADRLIAPLAASRSAPPTRR